MAYVLCFRNVVIWIVIVNWGLASWRELGWRWSMSKTHQMAVLLKTCGHRWLAGFRRLLQITFLFDLPTHCRIPVVLDSIISSAQKYITQKCYKQKFQFRLELIDRKLFLTETFSFGPLIVLFLFNCLGLLQLLKSCFPYYLVKNP